MARKNLQKTSQSRVFIIEDRAGPSHVPLYLTLGRAQSPGKEYGDITPIRVPDPGAYGKFIVIDKIRGAAGLPTLTIQARYQRDLSALLALGDKGCAVDLQVHSGSCQDPSDFDRGYDLALILEDANIASWGTDDQGALDQSEDAVINENVPLVGTNLYQVVPIAGGAIGTTSIAAAVAGVAICDGRACGECGRTSDGCQRVFAVVGPGDGSPTTAPALLFSDDGGGTFDTLEIDVFDPGTVPTSVFCSGPYVVVLGADGIAYATIDDLFAGTGAWTLVTTGLVLPTGTPAAGVSLGRTFNWIVGDNGYVYFSSDITAGVVVQSAGDVATDDLNDIDALDETHLIACGASSQVISTVNGGDSWVLESTFPGVGENLCCSMRSETTWFVGDNDGNLWYTEDAGLNWAAKTALPGSTTADTVDDISFSTPSVGYAVRGGAVVRTINGGQSWNALSTPAAGATTVLSACSTKPNVLYGGGSGGGGSMFKAAA